MPETEDDQDGLESRLADAASKVDALESVRFDSERLRRLLDDAQSRLRRGMPHQAAAAADDLETRLRMAEEELKDTARAFFKASWSLNPASQISPDALRRAILEEAVEVIKATLSSRAFRDLSEAAAAATAREASAQESAALADRMMTAIAETREAQREEARASRVPLESGMADLAARLGRLEALLAEERKQATLDAETLERQIASLEVTAGSLQDRVQALEARPVPSASPVAPAPAPPPVPPVDLTPLLLRLKALEDRAIPPPTPPVDLGPLEARLARLEAAPQATGQGAASAPDAGMPDPALMAAVIRAEVRTAAAAAVEDLRREIDARLAAVPTAEAVEAAVLGAGAALDRQLSERLGSLLAAQPPASPATMAPAPAPDAAFLGQVRDLVQQALADAFPLEELGRIVEQKVAKRTEAMRAEMREVEAALVKATMKHLEAQPAPGTPPAESQLAEMVERQIERSLLKYIQK